MTSRINKPEAQSIPVLVVPPEIRFRDDFKLTQQLTVFNPYKQPLNFHIKATRIDIYLCSPTSGVLPAQSSVSIHIRLRSARVATSNQDSFLVQLSDDTRTLQGSVIVPVSFSPSTPTPASPLASSASLPSPPPSSSSDYARANEVSRATPRGDQSFKSLLPFVVAVCFVLYLSTEPLPFQCSTSIWLAFLAGMVAMVMHVGSL
eukprot:TRINITY_DN12265_c0_g1_i2.p1 TRINITY_DN12265_c0_g1~~TRINITY_DN12265_c0_g1_i2.p1  ORF type:complete len:204 (+),score=6.72 TRINITY_DN12265_c0_g1_i2:98-709(+)